MPLHNNNNNNNTDEPGVPKKTIQVQATSAELLVGLGEFLRCRCRRLRHFDGTEVSVWLRSVDRTLLDHAWQDMPFIGPANLVFIYLLARDAVDPDIVTAGELQAVVMACLYVAYSYVGCEISYPLKPFISAAGVDEATATAGGPGKKRFWHRCLTVIERSSGQMLRLHQDACMFADLFRELKTYAASCMSTVVSTAAMTTVRSRRTDCRLIVRGEE
jgi:cyclin-dependent kinase 5 activator 1